MRKRLKRISVSFLLAFAMALVPSTAVFINNADTAYAADKTNVTIYTTNDIHGNVAEVKKDGNTTNIGLPQVAGIVASTENALLVDAGDATQGTSFATVTKGEDVIEVMNAAGYDLMAAGNHEFDYGIDQLMKNKESAEFKMISANVTKDGANLFDGYVIKEVADKKIGFIGLTTVSTATSTNPAQLNGVEFQDEAKSAQDKIDEISDKVDAIVLVCHMGNDEAAVKEHTSKWLLDQLKLNGRLSKVAAVVDGHSHIVEDPNAAGSEYQYKYDGGMIPIVEAGVNLQALGKLTLTFDSDNKVSAKGEVMDGNTAAAFTLTNDGVNAKAAVDAKLDEINAEQAKVLGTRLCENDTPLWGGYIYFDYAEPRIVETNYGDFVTDAFLESAKRFAENGKITIPVIAVENGGGISATLPYGTVTRGDVLNAFNHGNMVQVIEVTPKQLFEALEGGLVATGQDETGMLTRERVSGSFLQCSGFKYTYDPGAASGAKVTEVVLDDGTILDRGDESSKLLLATNDYVVGEMEKIDGIGDITKIGELGGEDMTVQDYILKQTDNGTKHLNVPVTANRIRIAPDGSPDTYVVSVPMESAKNVPVKGEYIVHLRVDGGKEKTYTTDSDGVLRISLPKGPHTLYLRESLDQVPVYVNNYSGSGTVTTADGYYHLGFVIDPDANKKPSAAQTDNSDQNGTNTSDGSAVTGDEAHPGAWGIIALLSLLGIAAVCIAPGKRNIFR